MDFPIITSNPPNTPRERGERLPQVTPEAPHPQRTALSQTIFIKGYTPIGNNDFIDVEFQEVFDHKAPSSNLSKWPDRSLRNAINLYYKAAQGKRLNPHTIDLYV